MTGNPQTFAFAPYADVTGSISLSAQTATTVTLKDGESNYDSFPAPANPGLPDLYLEVGFTTATAGTPSQVELSLTSVSCFTSGHSYDADIDQMGLTTATSAGAASNNGNTQTFFFSSNALSGGTTQIEVYETQ